MFPSESSVGFGTLSARQSNCIDEKTCTQDLSCPTCAADQECQMKLITCTSCARMECVAKEVPTTTPQVGGGTNVGGIVGGVVGGVAVIGMATYLIWRFCIKNKRQSVDMTDWDEKEYQDQPRELDGTGRSEFAAQRDQQSSTHTRHSVASTVLTRASNIIQIAYIPGVTNRATPTSPTVLVPPVPPIPIAVSQASSPAAPEDQHFFMPGDLRPDSTYSALSTFTDRTSYARTSYAPRSSIASTIYGKSAVVVAPAQTGMRAKPAMVSVKSIGGQSGSTTGTNTPPVPSVDYEKYTAGMDVPRPPSPAGSTFSVGSTFLNQTAHSAMAARPQVVRVVTNGPKKSGSAASSTTGVPAPSPLAQISTPPLESPTVTIIEEGSPRADQGPFADPPAMSAEAHKSSTSLSAVIEEATRRASHRVSHREPSSGSSTAVGSGSDNRDRSPFGDEHATRNQ